MASGDIGGSESDLFKLASDEVMDVTCNPCVDTSDGLVDFTSNPFVDTSNELVDFTCNPCIDTSDELVDFSCNPCVDRNNSTVQASFYCAMCDEFYCTSCLQIHKSFKANKSDLVYGRDKMEYWGQAKTSTSQLPTEECPDHPGEWIKMICLNHTTLCCSECVVHNHRTCLDMKHLPNIATGIRESQDMSFVGQTIDQYITYVEEMLKSDTNTQATIDQSKTDCLETVKTIRTQANDFFRTLEENATTEIDKCHADIKSGLYQHLKDLNDNKDKLTHLQMTIQPSSTNNEAQLFIKMFMAQQQLHEIENQLQKLAKTPRTKKFSITITPKLQEMFSTVNDLVKTEAEIITIQRHLPKLEPLPLLQLIQSPSPSTPTLPQKQGRQQQTPPTSSAPSVATLPTVPSKYTLKLKQKQTHVYSATNGRKINVKMSSDKQDCSIYGSCQMPNGDILLTDRVNKKVKRLNGNYETTDYLQLKAEPISTCCIGDDQALVTSSNRTIHFLSITRCKMSVTRSIGVDHGCYGIAHVNGRLFVSNGGTKVVIYTPSGKCLKTIQNSNKVNMFSKSQHICVSPSGRRIYVTDLNKGVVALDSEGNHLSTYSSVDLRGACGVCVDSQGRVLVCGNNSSNVLQLDEEGTTVVGSVASPEDGIKLPRSLCIDNHSSILIVSQTNPLVISNQIIVFDLKLVS